MFSWTLPRREALMASEINDSVFVDPVMGEDQGLPYATEADFERARRFGWDRCQDLVSTVKAMRRAADSWERSALRSDGPAYYKEMDEVRELRNCAARLEAGKS